MFDAHLRETWVDLRQTTSEMILGLFYAYHQLNNNYSIIRNLMVAVSNSFDIHKLVITYSRSLMLRSSNYNSFLLAIWLISR